LRASFKSSAVVFIPVFKANCQIKAMSTEEYMHKFAVGSFEGKTQAHITDFEFIERKVKESGFKGRYLVHTTDIPEFYRGFVLETDRMPTKKEFKKLDALGLKEINY
jgi:hypothetical protein